MTDRSERFSGFQKFGKEPGAEPWIDTEIVGSTLRTRGDPMDSIKDGIFLNGFGYKYLSKKWLCFIFPKDHRLKISVKTLLGRISGRIGMIIFTHSLFLSLNLCLNSLSFQIRRMVTIRIGSRNCHWIWCGITTIPS